MLLHTVVDAILGALCLPDIGQLFPDTDPRWKGARRCAAAAARCQHVLLLAGVAGVQGSRQGSRGALCGMQRLPCSSGHHHHQVYCSTRSNIFLQGAMQLGQAARKWMLAEAAHHALHPHSSIPPCSDIFLKEAVRLMRERGYTIGNIDCTIIAQVGMQRSRCRQHV